ncbi:hypothetical protein HRI_002944200 [Hibiscus trionum]|uniref:Transcription repressor n=1 Tax=Hibiscus trionum TaxID=183268 RepID=A0A9W7M9W4_HIBTR|nr:hypothetical protein HRI_002944200 [Hibiscus trionum]
MENRFKLRISRMFRSSLSSCRTRNISDVIEKPVFSPQNHNNFHLVEPLSPSPPHKAPSLPSISKPREALPRRMSSARYPTFIVSAADLHDRKFPPPAAPAMPLNIFSDCKDFGFYEKKKKKSIPRNKNKKKKKNNQRVHVKSKHMSSTAVFFSSSPQESANSSRNNYYGGWWFSSEDETETLFSSRTRSSDSSESLRQHANCRKTRKTRRRRAKNRSSEMRVGVLPPDEVKDSFAVVKSSSDPYNDFRTSMVEMIVERQLFAAEDLEQLLQCFLSLNSHHHHNIIVEVFTEIWETLFS